MLLVGLTGGIGMGKSTVARWLVRRGELLIDTDELAREVVQPGRPALEEIRREFGPAVFDASGALDRAALAAVIFSDAQRRKALEAIVHPRVRRRWREQVELWRRGNARRAVVVIPLLFETGAEAELDRTVCVACSDALQRERLRARGWREEEIEARIRAQWPAARKMERADGVIWNESTLEVCELQAARLFP